MKDLEKSIFMTLGSLRTVITIQFSSYYITMKMRANLCCRNTPVITHPIITTSLNVDSILIIIKANSTQ